ncbi:MAG: YihY/virulence factor BrkB family protein [Bacteroidota bacterium]
MASKNKEDNNNLKSNSIKLVDTGKEVLEILWQKIIHFDIDSRAAAVAFNFTLAVFPTIIFLFTLIPYIPIDQLDLQILSFLEDIMPRGLFLEAKSTIIDIVSKKRGDVLSLGFLFALYASTSGMMSLMATFNLTYRTSANRGFVKERLIALLLNFLLTFILFLAVLILIVGRKIIDIFLERGWLTEDFNYFALHATRYGVVFLMLFVAVSIIYYVAPSIHKRWKFINAGSITASILIILSTNLFSYYLSNFASYNRLYGSIGTIIALMLWLYLVALILIVGFEINASHDQSKAKYL